MAERQTELVCPCEPDANGGCEARRGSTPELCAAERQTEFAPIEPESFASVIRSPLDDRVWCAVIPNDDQWSGTMHASSSLRRCKRYAEGKVEQHLGDDLGAVRWFRTSIDTWDLYERDNLPVSEG